MPPRGQPTARQARLGAELRKLRDAAGMSAAEAAASLGWERPQISHIESGRYGVSAERVRHMAAHYSARDTAYIDALATMAEDHTRGWWREYRNDLPAGSLDLAELEHHAAYLREVQTFRIHGLLQTEDYARAVFHGSITARPQAEIDAAVQHRMSRRRVLDRPAPRTYDALFHEAALRVRYGTREVMRAQLGHLLKAADLPTVTIRVVPFATGELTSSIQSFLYAGGPVPQLDTVQVDNAFDGVLLDAHAQLEKYRALLVSLERVALSPDDSSDLIRTIAKEM